MAERFEVVVDRFAAAFNSQLGSWLGEMGDDRLRAVVRLLLHGLSFLASGTPGAHALLDDLSQVWEFRWNAQPDESPKNAVEQEEHKARVRRFVDFCVELMGRRDLADMDESDISDLAGLLDKVRRAEILSATALDTARERAAEVLDLLNL
ncbi:MAG: hypothetical protein ACR2RB_09535 [Gammaproteobacteria bacterium]